MWRGGEQQIAYLIEELEEKGVHNVVVCRKNSAFETYCEQKKIPYKAIAFNPYNVKDALHVKTLCSHFEADLCHIHSSRSHAMAMMSYLLGCITPFVLHRRVNFPINNTLINKYKYNLSLIKQIVCVSRRIEEIVVKEVKDRSKVQTIYSGIDIERYSHTDKRTFRTRLGLSEDFFLIGNISALSDEKDYYTWIDTAEHLLQHERTGRPLHFVIAGTGDQATALEQYVAKKNLTNKITFTGFVREIPELLSALDLFLITSKSEGLGTSVLEAMAAGTPVVATDTGGIPEMVTSEENGLLAPVGDVTTLASQCKRILYDGELRESLVSNAYQTVKRFSKEEMARRVYKVYKKVLAEKEEKSSN